MTSTEIFKPTYKRLRTKLETREIINLGKIVHKFLQNS